MKETELLMRTFWVDHIIIYQLQKEISPYKHPQDLLSVYDINVNGKVVKCNHFQLLRGYIFKRVNKKCNITIAYCMCLISQYVNNLTVGICVPNMVKYKITEIVRIYTPTQFENMKINLCSRVQCNVIGGIVRNIKYEIFFCLNV